MDEEAAVFPLSLLSPYLLRVPEAPSVAATNPPADPTLLTGTTIGFGGSSSTVVPHHYVIVMICVVLGNEICIVADDQV